MLSAARSFHQVDLSEKLFTKMKTLFPENKIKLIPASILLSNTYSSVGDYRSARQERSNRIKQFGNNVTIGLSWTEVNDKIVVTEQFIFI